MGYMVILNHFFITKSAKNPLFTRLYKGSTVLIPILYGNHNGSVFNHSFIITVLIPILYGNHNLEEKKNMVI